MSTLSPTTASKTRRTVEAVPQEIADAVQEGSDRLAPALAEAAERAKSLARQGANALREQAAHLRERTAQASDVTTGYIRDEPLKSVLIAAAAGAALMAMANFAMRERSSR